jgi:HD-GYP domain-containing protein (c-di-GMP phosphodiesterase class II)
MKKNFQYHVMILLVLGIMFVMTLSEFLIYQFTLEKQFDQLREKLKVVAQTAALNIDHTVVAQVPLIREGVTSEPYQVLARQLQSIQEANSFLTDIYILRRTEKAGLWEFVVNIVAPASRDVPASTQAYPGQEYDVSRFSDMMKSFSGATADKALTKDEWGATLSGYAPIKDGKGYSFAVLGVDMSAQEVYALQQQIHWRASIIFVLGIILAVILGWIISRRLTSRIKNLAEGTRRLSYGDLDFRVKEEGQDEIAELARSFNEMALRLKESRQRLREYFYCVIQSLAKALEAKDAYTSGHSERVAAYAKRIALAMGFPEEKAELLFRVAQLHDIGKLNVPQEILNKKEKLSDEDWAVIRQHPAVGSKVVEPIFPDEETLSVVRSHHERFDGKGYPDGLRGSGIPVFAQIVAVADAYDAMTSHRAYRQALSPQVVREELLKGCGTQFNGEIVKVFLNVLGDQAGLSVDSQVAKER